MILDIRSADFATRSTWSKERSSHGWLSILQTLVDHSWWLHNLRMSHSTFTYICRELAPHISKQCTTMREPIELERRVAVTIWRLATNVEYRTLGELFGLGRSTVGKIVLETCEAIAQHLLQVHVCFPTDQALKQVIRGFDAKSGFPQAVGAIDGTHIPIISSSL